MSIDQDLENIDRDMFHIFWGYIKKHFRIYVYDILVFVKRY